MKRPTYRALADRREDGENAVDRAVALRTKNKRRDGELARLAAAIVAALGEGRGLWFEYEGLIGDRTIEREEAAFDLGVAHGRAAERADRLAPSTYAVRTLSDELRVCVLRTGLSHDDAIAALVLTTWGVLGAPTLQPSPPKKKGHR